MNDGRDNLRCAYTSRAFWTGLDGRPNFAEDGYKYDLNEDGQTYARVAGQARTKAVKDILAAEKETGRQWSTEEGDRFIDRAIRSAVQQAISFMDANCKTNILSKVMWISSSTRIPRKK